MLHDKHTSHQLFVLNFVCDKCTYSYCRKRIIYVPQTLEVSKSNVCWRFLNNLTVASKL